MYICAHISNNYSNNKKYSPGIKRKVRKVMCSGGGSSAAEPSNDVNRSMSNNVVNGYELQNKSMLLFLQHICQTDFVFLFAAFYMFCVRFLILFFLIKIAPYVVLHVMKTRFNFQIVPFSVKKNTREIILLTSSSAVIFSLSSHYERICVQCCQHQGREKR